MIETLSGACAGVVGTIVGHPLDTVKVRLQTHPGLYHGLTDCFVKLVQSEGLNSLYRGISSSLLSLTILNTVAFGLFGETKKLMSKSLNRDLKQLDFFLVGGFVGFCSGFISTPFEMVKVQLQLDNISGKKFKGSLNCATIILQNHGIRGIYTGFNSNMIRESLFASTYFGLYENIKRKLTTLISGPLAIPISGGLSGATAWVVSFPLDVIKSNVQSKSPISGDHLSMKQIIQLKYRKQGLQGFYFGVRSSIIRAFIVSSIRFSTYEFAFVKLNQWKNRLIS